MKKSLLFIALLVLPSLGFSQDIFNKYAENNDVTYVAMQPKMFQMLAKMSISGDDPESKDFFSLVNSITSFKVITTESASISKDLDSWVAKKLSTATYQELMRVRDGDSNVKFYVKEGKDADHVKELLMLVTGLQDRKELQDVDMNGLKIETVLLSLTGDIDLKKIATLTDKMNLPGGKELGKASKKGK
tara:strand:- start:28891 stop:29457 length:567 start_codon:yes stop_codon:yes gene_type:complete